jgi:hypothetical protein
MTGQITYANVVREAATKPVRNVGVVESSKRFLTRFVRRITSSDVLPRIPRPVSPRMIAPPTHGISWAKAVCATDLQSIPESVDDFEILEKDSAPTIVEDFAPVDISMIAADEAFDEAKVHPLPRTDEFLTDKTFTVELAASYISL